MTRRGDETKARILEAAAELFWKNGYHTVNVGLISETARINKATLYQYFSSKESLALAVIEDNFVRTRDYVYDGAEGCA